MYRGDQFPIFVPASFIDEAEMDYYEIIDWCWENLRESSANALFLTLEDIYFLQENSRIFDVINEESDSMIGPHEDSSIHSQEIKRKIIERLLLYGRCYSEGRVRKLFERILNMFQLAIDTDKGIYFRF